MESFNFGAFDPTIGARLANIPQEAQKQQTANMLQAMQMQGAMNQNALSQYTLSKAKREDELTNQLLGDLRGATTDAEIYRAYQRAGKGKEASELQSAALTRQKLAGEILAQPGDRTYKEEQTRKLKRDADIASAQHAYENLSRLSTLDGGASDEDISAVIGDAVRTQGLAMSDATRLQKSLLALPLEQRSQRLALLAGSASDRLRAITPDIRQVTTPTGGVDFRDFSPFSQGFGRTPAGFSNLAPDMTPYQRGSLGVAQGNLNVARGNLNVAQARSTDEGVGTYGEYSPKMLREMAAKGMQPDGKGGQTFIPGGEKDPAAIVRLEAAKAEGAATGKDMVAAVRTLPNAIASSQKAITNIDDMLGDSRVVGNKITFNKKPPHPGFENAVGTGIGLRFIPGTDASDFQERFREITSGAFLEAFESLRGGGSITEKEGEKATAAKTRMSLAQSEREFVTAAREYQNIIRVGVGRAQERLAKARGASAGSTGGGAPTVNIDDLLDKYK